MGFIKLEIKDKKYIETLETDSNEIAELITCLIYNHPELKKFIELSLKVLNDN